MITFCRMLIVCGVLAGAFSGFAQLECKPWAAVDGLGRELPVAEEGGWGERLTRRVSPRWQETQEELQDIEAGLALLPKISMEDSGGTGGLATFSQSPVVTADVPELQINVIWPQPKMVDMVALVPARQYDVNGIVLDYGLPDAFSVELIGADGKAISVATERGVRSSAVRSGYPFVYLLETPVMATGLYIKALRLVRAEDYYLLAFSEILCFSNGRNVARDARVETPHQPGHRLHWHWQNRFAVDGQTTLGLPEIPRDEREEIGWLSRDRASEDEPAWIVVDLGESRRFDGLSIYPIRRPSKGTLPGFGLPRRFRIGVSERGIPASYLTVWDYTNHDMGNPGHNPVEVRFPSVKARYVRFEATKLWKPFESYPAFLALSEIQVLQGEQNVARDAVVVSSDQIGRVRAHGSLVWSEASLTDGYGPQGMLVRPEEWFRGLNQRVKLETRKQALSVEAAAITASVRYGVFGLLAVLGGCGLVFSLIFPLRSRQLRKRDILRMRESIAGDLHDEVGSNLGGIQLFADLALRKLPESSELTSVKDLAAETVAAVRDIVWLLRPRASQRVGLVEHLKETSSILLGALEWTFQVDPELKNYDVSSDRAHNFMLFFREALHNLRHANAQTVAIGLTREEHTIKLSIRDDGSGMAPETLQKPSVLRALRQRAERMQGKLDVWSNVGEGTRVTLTIPE